MTTDDRVEIAFEDGGFNFQFNEPTLDDLIVVSKWIPKFATGVDEALSECVDLLICRCARQWASSEVPRGLRGLSFLTDFAKKRGMHPRHIASLQVIFQEYFLPTKDLEDIQEELPKETTFSADGYEITTVTLSSGKKAVFRELGYREIKTELRVRVSAKSSWAVAFIRQMRQLRKSLLSVDGFDYPQNEDFTSWPLSIGETMELLRAWSAVHGAIPTSGKRLTISGTA